LLASRTVSGLVWELSPADPVSLAAGALTLEGVGLLAVLLPALRMGRLPPSTVPRQEQGGGGGPAEPSTRGRESVADTDGRGIGGQRRPPERPSVGTRDGSSGVWGPRRTRNDRASGPRRIFGRLGSMENPERPSVGPATDLRAFGVHGEPGTT